MSTSLLRSCLAFAVVASSLATRIGAEEAGKQEYHPRGDGRPNVQADFSPTISTPVVDHSAYLDPKSSVIGAVSIGSRVYVAPFASVRGDEGQPVAIGNESNVQDGVVVHALETWAHGRRQEGNIYVVNGKDYGVFVGDRVSLAHQAQVHGPAWIENDVFVGMQSFVFRAHVGAGCVIEPGAKVFGRQGKIDIPPRKYVMAGTLVLTQEEADHLPDIYPGYPFANLNNGVLHVNTSLADGYNGKPAHAEEETPEGEKPKDH